MNPELSRLLARSAKITAVLTVAALCVCILLWIITKDIQWLSGGAGIVLGAFAAWIGLLLLSLWAQSLGNSRHAFGAAFGSYTLRYALYAAVIAASVFWWHMPPLAAAAGILIQKASLLLIAYLDRKENS